METIYCKGVRHDIKLRECYHAASNENCISCNFFVNIPKVKFKRPPINRSPKGSSFDLDNVSRDYKYLTEVHPSFWTNPKFRRWQLMRLNIEYRKDFEDVWGVWAEYLIKTKTFDELKPYIMKLDQNFLPSPGESFDEWSKYHLTRDSSFYEEDGRFKGMDLHKLQILEVYKSEDSPFDYAGFRDTDGKRSLFSPLTYMQMNPPPISWEIHFPHPYFLDKLPPWIDIDKEKRGGRPFKNWALSLSVYELSRNGASDSEIAKALLGKKAFKKNYAVSPKKSVYNRIKDIKERVCKLVDQAYPLPPMIGH